MVTLSKYGLLIARCPKPIAPGQFEVAYSGRGLQLSGEDGLDVYRGASCLLAEPAGLVEQPTLELNQLWVALMWAYGRKEA